MKNKKEQTNHHPNEDHPLLEHEKMLSNSNDDHLMSNDHRHHHNSVYQHDSQVVDSYSEQTMVMDNPHNKHHYGHHEHHNYLIHIQDFYIRVKIKDWNKRSVANLTKLLVGCVITCALSKHSGKVWPNYFVGYFGTGKCFINI